MKMDFDIKEIISNRNLGEKILIVLLIIFILLDIKLPDMIAFSVDNMFGKIALVVIIIFLFLNKHYILAVLLIWAAYKLVRISSNMTGIDSLRKWLPTEKKKFTELTALNQFPYTLEQEMVKLRTNGKFYSGNGSGLFSRSTFKPMLENTRDASNILTA